MFQCMCLYNNQQVHHNVSASGSVWTVKRYTMTFQCLYYNQYGQHAVTVSMPNNQLIHYDVSVSVSVWTISMYTLMFSVYVSDHSSCTPTISMYTMMFQCLSEQSTCTSWCLSLSVWIINMYTMMFQFLHLSEQNPHAQLWCFSVCVCLNNQHVCLGVSVPMSEQPACTPWCFSVYVWTTSMYTMMFQGLCLCE